MSSISRRTLLRGASGFALALPWLEALSQRAAAQAVNRPRRMVTFVHHMGSAMEAWSPTDSTLTNLPPLLQPLAAHRAKLLVVEGLDNKAAYLNANLGGHFAAFSLLAGEAASANLDAAGNLLPSADHHAPNDSFAGGPSIEHLVGARIRAGQPHLSVNLAIGSQNNAPAPNTPYTRSMLTSASTARFFARRNEPVFSEVNPFAAFARFFSTLPQNQADLAAEALRRERKSVLDKVRDDFTALQRRVGLEDRQRLDAHATKVRDLELRLTAAMPPSVQCGQPWAQVPAATTTPYWVDEGITGPLQRRMLALAMACNLAPVGTLIHDHFHDPSFSWLNGGTSIIPAAFANWHDIAHMGRPESPMGPQYSPTYCPALVSGFRSYSESFANLLTELDSIPEEGGTVLDHTLVLWVSEFGEGYGHQAAKLPVVLAGNLGGATRGRVLRVPTVTGATSGYYRQSQNFFTPPSACTNNLYVSILQAFGQSDTTFGRSGTSMVNNSPVTINPGPLAGFSA